MPDPRVVPPKEAQPAETPSKHKTAEALRALAKALESVEKTTGRSGAVPRTPKQRMYNIKELKKANPEKHYRYVNVDDEEKAQARIEDGYVATSAAEAEKYGARTDIGSTRLMELPRDKAEARRRELDETTRGRLKADKREFENIIEGVAKELRDRHGLNVDPRRLIVDE